MLDDPTLIARTKTGAGGHMFHRIAERTRTAIFSLVSDTAGDAGDLSGPRTGDRARPSSHESRTRATARLRKRYDAASAVGFSASLSKTGRHLNGHSRMANDAEP